MKKNKKIFALVATASAIFSASSFGSSPVIATDAFCNQSGLSDAVKNEMGCNLTKKLDGSIVSIVKYVIGAAAVVAVIYIVIGGINYMTSAGDPGKVTKAKNTIIYALIGLILCALAFAIVNWAVSGINGA